MKTQNPFSGNQDAAWQTALEVFGPELVFEAALEQILEEYITSRDNETELVQEKPLSATTAKVMPFPLPRGHAKTRRKPAFKNCEEGLLNKEEK